MHETSRDSLKVVSRERVGPEYRPLQAEVNSVSALAMMEKD